MPTFPYVRSLAMTLLVCAAASPLAAQRPARADSARRDTTQQLQTVEIRGAVTGVGQARTVNAITAADLQLAVPGTSALKVLERLPGVNVQGADPFGRYEWANRVTIRGFQSGQIGQTFDGIPLGDMSYGNFNGLGIGRAIDPDNLGDASVAQGTGALGTASSNNLGGVIQYTSGDPRNQRTFDLRQMFGTDNARRTFGRFDTGLAQLGATSALKAYVSFSRYDTDKWKGSGVPYSPEISGLFGQGGFLGDAGEQWQDQLNLKSDLLVGAHKFSLFYNFSNRTELDYTDLSMARFTQSGRDWDQFSNWSDAVAGATSATQDEAYFHSALGARRDHLAYLSAAMQFGEKARVDIRPYFHSNKGNGDWHAPSYGGAFSPDPIYFRQTQYESDRLGVTARGTFELPGNRIEAGVWYESNEPTIRRVGWRLNNYTVGPEVDFNNIIALFFDRTGKFGTTTVFAQNSNSLLNDRLKLTYGAKYLNISADFVNNGKTIPGAALAPDVARPNVSIPTDGGILPQVGAVFELNATEQVYANYSQNVNAYPYSPQSGVYNTNPAAFGFFKDNTDPEKAYTYEIGVRTRRDRFEASLGVYNIDYRNRLIGVSVCPPTATCVSSFANVGAQTSRGVEGLFSWSLVPGLSWVNSGSYNDSRIDNNYLSGTTTIASADKKVVNAPEVMFNSLLKLNRNNWLGSLNARHVGKRYFTILNDLSVDAFTRYDAALGYEFRKVAGLRDLIVQVNAQNLTDESYIGSMGTNGFTVTGDNQTLMAGPKRMVFFSVGTRF